VQLFFTPILQRASVLVAGAEMTALISLAAMFFSLLLGFALMLARISRRRMVSRAAVAYLDLFRNTPFVIQLFFFYFGLPEIGVHIDELPTGVLALSLATATSVAEILRAGVEGVDHGIVEAGRSFGFSGLPLFAPPHHLADRAAHGDPAADQRVRELGADDIGPVHHHGERVDGQRRKHRVGNVPAI